MPLKKNQFKEVKVTHVRFLIDPVELQQATSGRIMVCHGLNSTNVHIMVQNYHLPYALTGYNYYVLDKNSIEIQFNPEILTGPQALMIDIVG